MAFIEPYAVPSSVVTYVGTNTNPYKQAFIRAIYLGTASTTNGHIDFRQNLSSYTANLYAPSTALSGNINIHLPDAAGTLATQEYLSNTFAVYGSNTNGKYLKFDNGVLICWKAVSITANCTTAWGSVYESQMIDLGSYAYSFKSGNTPQVSLASRGINATFEGLADASTTTIGKVRMWRPTSASQSGYIDVVAIGIWK